MDEQRIATERRKVPLSKKNLFLVDGALLLIAFLLSNYLKRGELIPTPEYGMLLWWFSAAWFVSALTAKKFHPAEFATYRRGLRTLFKANAYLAYCISFIIVFFGLTTYSRSQVFVACLLLLILDLGLWSVIQRFLVRQSTGCAAADPPRPEPASENREISYRLLATDLCLLLFSFFMVNLMKRGHFELLPQYDRLLLLLVAVWFLAGLITEKYHIATSKNVYDLLWQWAKAGLIMLASLSAAIYGLRLFHYSRFQSLGTVGLLMVLEGLLVAFVFSGRRQAARQKDIESAREVHQILDQAPMDLNVDFEAVRRRLLSPVRQKLASELKTTDPAVYEFIGDHVDIDDILCLETEIGTCCAPMARSIDASPLRLMINFNKLNDIRRLNRYFLDIHQTLMPGGCFVGYAHTIRTHHQWVYQKFPRLLAHLVYAADFFIHRVLPKLPRINALYFMITRGRNRVLSRAELLGRLSFCGFDIVAEDEFNRRYWVIAKKVKKPSFQTNPTYGPLVTLNRTGHRGEPIKVFKLRTMHPYSEYLQKFVFDRHGLQQGGKLKDDFRLTSWGKVFRKLWIDELPMLYNWLKGDLKIVGVRPLSSHYLSLYDEDLRRMRQKTKPGLLPPFYMDLPATFEEICASEKRYLEAYFKNPVATDLRYFFGSLFNIFIKRARSN
jgi:lipopolysaccharide/colanic/teichoic acid biosynthesis glycosyltransferase